MCLAQHIFASLSANVFPVEKHSMTMQANKALQGAAAQAALANAAATGAAHVILADPGQQPNTGVVLSIAPLLGADAAVDRSHPRWLHVHVRPPVRGLLKLLKVEYALYVLRSRQDCVVILDSLLRWTHMDLIILSLLQFQMLALCLLAGLWGQCLFA